MAWVGSPNFTAQALTKSVAQGGNVELLVRSMMPADEVRCLESDLEVLFKKKSKTTPIAKRDLLIPAHPVATVVACEIVGYPNALRLVVHASIREGEVQFEHEKCHVAVKIRVAVAES